MLARRLSEDPTNTVAVIEAGPPDLNPWIHVPAGFMKTMTNPTVNWLYQYQPSEGTAGRTINQPRGKTLGGSSSINGHVYNRGARLDYDLWAQMGNRGWGYASVLPYFKRSERRVGPGDSTFRGQEGEFAVTDLDWRDPLCEAFIDGAVGMVKMALSELAEQDIVELDEERKAAMVSNLLVVLCSEDNAQPIVNAGSIY